MGSKSKRLLAVKVGEHIETVLILGPSGDFVSECWFSSQYDEVSKSWLELEGMLEALSTLAFFSFTSLKAISVIVLSKKAASQMVLSIMFRCVDMLTLNRTRSFVQLSSSRILLGL